MVGSSASRASSVKRLPRGLQLLPLSGTNGSTPPIAPMSASGGPELCTPVETQEHHTPPPELRRESLIVPASDKMVRMAQGSGVSVYRMDRSPREGRPRSPWVLKKANVSPLLVRAKPLGGRAIESLPAALSPGTPLVLVVLALGRASAVLVLLPWCLPPAAARPSPCPVRALHLPAHARHLIPRMTSSSRSPARLLHPFLRCASVVASSERLSTSHACLLP